MPTFLVDLQTFQGQIIIHSPVTLTGPFQRHFKKPKTGCEHHIITAADGKISLLHKGKPRIFALCDGQKLHCLRNGLIEDSLIHMMFPETLQLSGQIDSMESQDWSGTPIIDSARETIEPSGLDLSEWPLRFPMLRDAFLFYIPLNSVKFVLQPQ